MNELERVALQIEQQRLAQLDKENEAINKLINNDVEDRFKEFPVCSKCGKQKPHDNYPMCDSCFKIISQQMQKEDQNFLQGKHFAGMNNVIESDEDDYTTIMQNLDKYIK